MVGEERLQAGRPVTPLAPGSPVRILPNPIPGLRPGQVGEVVGIVAGDAWPVIVRFGDGWEARYGWDEVEPIYEGGIGGTL